jgi:hypothetical protein
MTGLLVKPEVTAEISGQAIPSDGIVIVSAVPVSFETSNTISHA